ncbi:MAG TPA: sigma-70 family RNA polymerase sigma factor [Ilumatobacteraceae bacterium]|nr:sigma-70 family RNA polymerase sigma factor [Ilumatobacteraceae bacterium]
MMPVGAGDLPADVSSAAGFAHFYRANLPTVYGYLVRLSGGDRSVAEDLCQETFLTLTAQLKRGDAAAADIRWLMTVARNKYLDHLRREQRRARHLRLLHPVDNGTEPDPDPTRSDVLEHLERLEPLHRTVLMLRYVDGLPVESIARDLGRTLPATYSLLARARTQLRQEGGTR